MCCIKVFDWICPCVEDLEYDDENNGIAFIEGHKGPFIAKYMIGASFILLAIGSVALTVLFAINIIPLGDFKIIACILTAVGGVISFGAGVLYIQIKYMEDQLRVQKGQGG